MRDLKLRQAHARFLIRINTDKLAMQPNLLGWLIGFVRSIIAKISLTAKAIYDGSEWF